MAAPEPNPRLTPRFEEALRRYLLGELDDALRAELEELLVTDPQAFEALGVVQDELEEELLDGEAGAGVQRAVARSVAGSRRLRFARVLRERAARQLLQNAQPAPVPAAGRSWPVLIGLAAALALSLAGNLWLAARLSVEPLAPPEVATSRPATPPALQARAETPMDTAPSADLERERAGREQAEQRAHTLEQQLRRAQASLVSFALAAGTFRSAGGTQRVELPPTAEAARLRLELGAEGGHDEYGAVLQDAEGVELWSASRLKPEAEGGRAAVVVFLPASLLPRGDYQLKLSGISERGEREPLATYVFRVVRPRP